MSTSQIPMHTGIVNPVRDEYVYDSLEVLGTIPAELDGTLYRNSVNPRFRALNPAAFHVFDGDGMMHAFTLRDGKASYRNKWVRTEGLEFEMKADQALYNGFFGESGLPQCDLPADAPVLKIASAVNAIALGDRVYALQETADHWYELIPDTLDVREVWDFHGQVKGRGLMTAHPHTDPRNGDLLFYTYDSVTLNLDVCRATRDGSFVQRHSVALDAPAYIHDFIFTEDYYVFMLGPVGWHTNLADYVTVGRSSWTFDAEIGGRVLVISRTDGSARWFSDDTSQLNHFLNAYQDGDRIIVDASVCEITGALTDRLVSEVYPFARGAGANPFMLSTIWRWTIDQRTGKVTHEPIGDVGNADMPRPNEEFLGRPYRYGYLLATADGQPGARYNTTIKHDFESGTDTVQRLTGEAHLSASEPIFVPRAGSVAEDDGWVLTVWGNRREGTSELLIQDATAFDAEPVARVKLNHYLPTTIHGNWIPASTRSDERQGAMMTDLLSGSTGIATGTPTDTPTDAQAVIDEGTAYGMGPGTSNLDLVQVGAGTPGGEALRRFWHPVALSTDVTDLPVPIRLLGEDLILFRTTRGRAGLVHPRCAHRGTTLLYGKVEDEGIRCCYHGWLFDPEGRTLEQPCEPDGGLKKHKFRQPWYPVQERYGIVFAYLGPPEHKPLLPRYAPIENVPEGMVAVPSNNTRILGGPPVIPCNWMQSYENVMDAWHVFVLHSTLSDVQFNTMFAVAPEITWEASPHGMRTLSTRRLPDGQVLRRVSEVMLPTVWTVPPPTQTSYGPGREIYWHQPIDDTHTRVFAVVVVPEAKAAAWHDRTHSPMYEGGTKSWYDLTDEEHRRFPGDYEAQVGQGEITLHSEEHLAGSDRGVSMYRRLWRTMIEDVRAGRDLSNVARMPGTETVTPKAGTYLGQASEATI